MMASDRLASTRLAYATRSVARSYSASVLLVVYLVHGFGTPGNDAGGTPRGCAQEAKGSGKVVGDVDVNNGAKGFYARAVL